MRPGLLAALGGGRDLGAVLADHPGIPALRLPRAPGARRKGGGERRRLRAEAFRSYLEAAPRWTLGLEGVRVEGDAVLLEPGRLVGLADAAGRDAAIGVVLGRAAGPRAALELRAPRPAVPVAALRPGSLRLAED